MPISALHFGKKSVYEENISAEKALRLVKDPHHVWIDVVRAEHEDLKEILKTILPEYYKLILGNVLEETKPKVSIYEDFVFVSVKTYPTGDLQQESQMSFVLGDDFLLTIRNGTTNLADVKQYFLQSKKKTADFAIYKILEVVVLKYFKVIDSVEDRIDYYEDQVIHEENSLSMKHSHFKDILHMKRELLRFHKTLVATRDVMISLSRGSLAQIKSRTAAYLREIYDDILQIIDVEETFRDVMTSVIEIHMTMVNNQLNQVMKTLTVVASFILVPTLIAGIYGMNFTHMPELSWQYGYPFALGTMVASVALLYVFFKKKGWA